MKQKMRKLLAAAMVTAMILATTAGCSSSNQESSGSQGSNSQSSNSQSAESSATGEQDGGTVTPAGELPIVESPTTLTIGLSPDESVQDYDTNYYTQYLEEHTGLDLEFFFFPSAETDTTQKLALMVSAQEKLPDILLTIPVSDSVKASYGKQGVFLALDDYFDQYGHFWKQTYDKYCTDTDKNLIDTLKLSPDGKTYGFPFYDVDPTDAQVETLYINKDWCRAVGKNIPTTTDELFDVLKAFRDEDPNGNGKKDELPMVGYNSVDERGDLIFILANSFLYYNWSDYGRFVVNDGKLSVGYNTDEFRDALRYVNKLYSEDLIAPISFTQDAAQLKALIDLPDGNDTLVGCVAVHPWSGSQGFTYTQDNYHKLSEYEAIGPLTGPDGVAWSPYKVSGLAFNTFITKDCENPEAAFRLLDFMSEETTALTSRRGEQGVDWDYCDDSKVSKFADLDFDAIYDVHNDVWAEAEQNKIYAIECHFLPPKLYAGLTAPEYDTDLFRQRDALYLDGFYRRYGQYPEDIVTRLTYTDEEMEEINELSTIITEYANEARVLFATGAKSLDTDWDSYVQELDKMGLDHWLQIAQNAYDRMYK